MEAQVAAEKQKIERLRSLIPDANGRIEEWERQLANIPDKEQVRRRALELRIENARKKIQYWSSTRPERICRRKLSPFLKAMNQISLGSDPPPASSKRKRSRELPSCRVKRGSGGLALGTKITKRDMLSEYLTLTSAAVELPEIEVDEGCPLCNVPLIVVDKKAQATCTKCGFSRQYLDSTTANVQYNSDMEFSSFSYKRVNHFNDWMSVIQAREATEVAPEVMQKVMAELYARRIRQTSQITIPVVKSILKKLRLRDAYENVTQIVCRLTGKPPPRLHPHLEECCRIMFIQIQPSFEKHKCERKNFLSYSYTLFKFLQLLGVEDIPMLHFSLLKGRDKLEKQDQIFKKICGDLDWEFIPSCG